MSEYRIVIVGLGSMGHHHAQTVQEVNGCRLVGGAEVDQERARSWHERFEAPTFDNYEAMLGDLEPDIAIVSTQAPLHHPVTLAASRCGIHVFCEKPMALDLAQADEVIETCDSFHVRLAINHVKRGSHYNRYVQKRIAAGDIGELVRIRAYEKGGRMAGNALMEMGTHLYDWICLFGGELEWTHSHLTQRDGRESTATDIRHSQEVNSRDRDAGPVLGERGFVTFRFASGIHADAEILPQTVMSDEHYGLDLIGMEGRFALRGSVGTWMFAHKGEHQLPRQAWQPVPLASEDLDNNGQLRDAAGKRLLIQKTLLLDFIEAIEEKREPVSSGRDGRASLEMIHSTWESQRCKGRVYSPLNPRTHPLERWLEEEGLPMRQPPTEISPLSPTLTPPRSR